MKDTIRKSILYIATSLDGYIAAPKDDLSFLSIVEQEDEDYGYYDFEKSVDTVIMGRKTYDWIWNEIKTTPYRDKKSYVITRRPLEKDENIIQYSGSLKELIQQLKTTPGKNIFIVGGSEIIHELLKYKLIDEFIISIIPILLGKGIKLFTPDYPSQNLSLIQSKSFESGLVQVHYRMSE
jgi:dihydrofolate reductase